MCYFRAPCDIYAQALWQAITDGKLGDRLLWDLVFNCREVKVNPETGDTITQHILRFYGCGLIYQCRQGPTPTESFSV